jgi:hypothetical protein
LDGAEDETEWQGVEVRDAEETEKEQDWQQSPPKQEQATMIRQRSRSRRGIVEQARENELANERARQLVANLTAGSSTSISAREVGHINGNSTLLHGHPIDIQTMDVSYELDLDENAPAHADSQSSEPVLGHDLHKMVTVVERVNESLVNYTGVDNIPPRTAFAGITVRYSLLTVACVDQRQAGLRRAMALALRKPPKALRLVNVTEVTVIENTMTRGVSETKPPTITTTSSVELDVRYQLISHSNISHSPIRTFFEAANGVATAYGSSGAIRTGELYERVSVTTMALLGTSGWLGKVTSIHSLNAAEEGTGRLPAWECNADRNECAAYTNVRSERSVFDESTPLRQVFGTNINPATGLHFGNRSLSNDGVGSGDASRSAHASSEEFTNEQFSLFEWRSANGGDFGTGPTTMLGVKGGEQYDVASWNTLGIEFATTKPVLVRARRWFYLSRPRPFLTRIDPN